MKNTTTVMNKIETGLITDNEALQLIKCYLVQSNLLDTLSRLFNNESSDLMGDTFSLVLDCFGAEDNAIYWLLSIAPMNSPAMVNNRGVRNQAAEKLLLEIKLSAKLKGWKKRKPDAHSIKEALITAFCSEIVCDTFTELGLFDSFMENKPYALEFILKLCGIDGDRLQSLVTCFYSMAQTAKTLEDARRLANAFYCIITSPDNTCYHYAEDNCQYCKE